VKTIKLVIREKGRYVELPGVPSFRSPGKVNVTKIKLPMLVQALHSCGVNNYELVSTDEKGEKRSYTKDEINFIEENKKDGEIGNKLDRMEELLIQLTSKRVGRKTNYSEQITNRLNRIESMLKQRVKVIRVSNEDPVSEELDDQYIPEIDISEMQIRGKTSNVVDQTNKKELDETVDLLSNLTKHGGR